LWTEARDLLSNLGSRNASFVGEDATTALAKHYFQSSQYPEVFQSSILAGLGSNTGLFPWFPLSFSPAHPLDFKDHGDI
jgi:hypothetical protein